MAHESTKAQTSDEQHFSMLRQLRSELPFLDTKFGKAPNWTFQAKGLYAGGCRTGEAAATAFLKALREARKKGSRYHFGLLLQLIALDMLLGKRSNDSLRGQAVGFFSTLGKVLFSVTPFMTDLDGVTFESLRDEMKQGLAYTKADEAKWLRGVRSEQARRGWETRRQRQAEQEVRP